MTDPATCRHNDIIVYEWRGKFRLIRICTICSGMVKYPETYWTRKQMEVASKQLKANLHKEKHS